MIVPKSNYRISIPSIKNGESFYIYERPDIWDRIYKIDPSYFEDVEDIEDELEEEDEEPEDEEPQDWSSEEYAIVHKYFEEGDTMRNIADSNDLYTYNYVRGVINKEKERRKNEEDSE